MTQEVAYAARSDTGLVRRVNEDSFVALPQHRLWAVADGMGGHDAGDKASQTVAQYLEALDPDLAPGDMVRALRDAVTRANSAIFEEAARHDASMGTTLVALALTDGHFAALWAGDSRLYRLQNGGLEMLTTDHSVLAPLVAAGELTWDSAEAHPLSNQITRAVGVDPVLELDKIKGAVEHGDRFLLCSDGLTKYTPLATLESLLSAGDPDTVADRLITHTIDHGAIDNVTVIVVDIA